MEKKKKKKQVMDYDDDDRGGHLNLEGHGNVDLGTITFNLSKQKKQGK